MPPSFAGRMRRKLQVGAAVENLRARCPYFYTVAEHFNGMITSEDIPAFVTATFTQRYKVSSRSPGKAATSAGAAMLRRGGSIAACQLRAGTACCVCDSAVPRLQDLLTNPTT